jgi:hypothetical protein
VSRALQKTYPDLLPPSEDLKENGSDAPYAAHTASPHDYLEKIFQIPLWLEPIDISGTQKLLHGLLQGTIKPQHVESKTDDNSGGVEVKSSTEVPERAAPTSNGGGIAPLQTQRQPDQPPHLATIELNASNLEITPDELQVMDQLAPVLGRSPRAVKRFVNCYRLIKASLKSAELEKYMQAEDYRPVMLLLSVLTGMPDLSTIFFKSIMHPMSEEKASSQSEDRTFAATLENIILGDWAEESADQRRLKGWLDSDYGAEWRGMPVERLEKFAVKVARYSFRVDRL